ncbi:FtsX-like permease family protein [Kribbella qitaiheensis]|uniref:FtsX-like permease family protein n=1 Tax=Kribbella qitaiheensis TaxID=1544730 RepID=A0A7G6X1C4_9ACTN|nr:FtsX-like permease family protein [Kribbella qitaiheensis]QNE20039.1 FtsX-like permease family protein [Kribbella qitaiheensis]
MGHNWGPALRIARRTALRSPGRTALIAALIGLPVMAASWLGMLALSMSPTGEARATELIGKADAQVVVTVHQTVTVDYQQVENGGYKYSQDPSKDVQRDPGKVDLSQLLPAGTKLAARTSTISTTTIRTTGSAAASYPVDLVDGTAGLSTGTYLLDQGRLPSATNEVALSPALAKHLGLLTGGKLKPGAEISAQDGPSYQVVGIAKTPAATKARSIWAPPTSPLASQGADAERGYLADLPATAELQALQEKLAGQGVVLTPRAVIVDPPAGFENSYAGSGIAVMMLVIGFGVLEIVLLAGTAFAVGARRQTRTLGLVAATGGTPADIRRIVLAQGIVIGLVGAGGGIAVAAVALVAGKPLWESLTGRLITEIQFPVGRLLLIGAIGAIAGLLAAVVPAHTAAKQPPMAALAGRFATSGRATKLRRPALLLVAGGVVAVVLGTSWMAAIYAHHKKDAAADPNVYQGGITPEQPIALILLGITCVIAGLVWVLPNLIARAATIGKALPLSGRLALRDAARHRHRTGPAAAAIMMSVAGTAAMAFALANSFAASAKDYVPTGRDGDAIVRYNGDNTSTGNTGTVIWTAALERNVAGALPTKSISRLGPVNPPGAHSERQGQFVYTDPLVAFPLGAHMAAAPLLAVDPDFIASLGGNGTEMAAELRAGKIIVQTPGFEGDKARLGTWAGTASGKERQILVSKLKPSHELAAFERQALVATQTAKTLGTITVQQTHLALTREPTKTELETAANFLGSEDALKIEKGYESPADLALVILLSAAGVVTLLGVAIAVSLSAAEGRADLATLAAVGAKPRQRRSLAAAQAWLIGQLGCVLGVFVGALYGYTARVAFGSPYFAIPWRELGGIVVVIPLAAGLLAWLLTRSRLPMVSRID